jgi:hypothetical protein
MLYSIPTNPLYAEKNLTEDQLLLLWASATLTFDDEVKPQGEGSRMTGVALQKWVTAKRNEQLKAESECELHRLFPNGRYPIDEGELQHLRRYSNYGVLRKACLVFYGLAIVVALLSSAKAVSIGLDDPLHTHWMVALTWVGALFTSCQLVLAGLFLTLICDQADASQVILNSIPEGKSKRMLGKDSWLA